ncbi:MAG: fibronectin type III domain-containing protein, partial [Schleiferiaceae bacterium]
MKHRTQRLLGALAFSVLSMPMFAQMSGTYNIDAAGTGTSNYTSFGSAIADLDSLGVSGAVTFNVASGTYTEQVNLGAVTGASSTNTITFQGGSSTAASILTYTPASSSDNWTVKMTGTDYVTFDNLTITSGGSTYGRLIVYTDTVTNFNLTNCHLIGTTTSGSSGSTSSFRAGLYYAYPAVAAGNWHISDNTFDSVTYAVYVYGLGYGAGSGADSVFVEDNTINANYNGFYVRYAKYQKMHDNVINDIKGNSLRNYAYYPVYELDVQNNQVNEAAYGLYCYTAPPTSGATGNIKVNVSNNHFEGTYYGLYVGGSGSSTTEKITDLTIENNTIEAWGSSYNYGIRLNYINASATARAKVQNNMISLNTTSTTGTLYGIYPYHCANVDMFHNSIAANGGSLTNSRLIYLNHSSSSSYFTPGGNSLKNNSVANLNGGRCVVGQSATTGSAAYCETGTNLFYTTNTAPYSNFTPGSTDLTGDPMYVNPLTDLHAQAQVADNAGAALGVLTDIDGDTRSTTTPDIGADEFAYVSQCFAPTGVTTSNVTASSFDASWSSANTAIGYHARAWAAGTTTYTYSSGTAGPASFTGLSANTSYSVEVRDICAVGDTSAW